MMTPYFWGLLSAFLAVYIEYQFRTQPSYLYCIPFVILPSIALNYSVYRLFTSVDHYLEAVLVFPLCTMSLRLVSNFFFLREPVSIGLLVGVGLLVVAQFVRLIK